MNALAENASVFPNLNSQNSNLEVRHLSNFQGGSLDAGDTGWAEARASAHRQSNFLNALLKDFPRPRAIMRPQLLMPQQNGAAERLNRAHVQRVRAMLHEFELNVDKWAEAAVTVSFIRNSSLVSGSQGTVEAFLQQ